MPDVRQPMLLLAWARIRSFSRCLGHYWQNELQPGYRGNSQGAYRPRDRRVRRDHGESSPIKPGSNFVCSMPQRASRLVSSRTTRSICLSSCDERVFGTTSKSFYQAGDHQSLLITDSKITGVTTLEGIEFRGKTVIVSSGTFMRGLLHIGNINYPGGRAGDRSVCRPLTQLEKLGFRLGRLKTGGTPPRVYRRSIDFSLLEEQHSEPTFTFLMMKRCSLLLNKSLATLPTRLKKRKKLSSTTYPPLRCTQEKSRGSPPAVALRLKMENGSLCRRERHQIFLEPEG